MKMLKSFRILPICMLFFVISPLDAAQAFVQILKDYFIESELPQTDEKQQSEELAVVRTALYNYAIAEGEFPDSLEQLTSSFPNNYLSDLPEGAREWVYNRPESFHKWDIEQQMAAILYPDDGEKEQIPFVPLQVSVFKDEHFLVLHAGRTVYEKFPIADGKNDTTPEGQFYIGKKVVNPNFHLANTTKPYGTRGMELSDPRYAIHGTYEEASIGQSVSKGCVRLAIADMEKLYDKVPLYTTVFIQDTKKDRLLQTRPLPVLLYQNETRAKEKQSSTDGNECRCAKRKGEPHKSDEIDYKTVYHWAG